MTGKAGGGVGSLLATFWTERLAADLERRRGLKECEDEYFVIPQPLLSRPA